MRLSELLRGPMEGQGVTTGGTATGGSTTGSEGEIEIRGLTADSRKIEPGFLFAALPGTQGRRPRLHRRGRRQGRRRRAGAAPAPSCRAGIALVADDNPRRRLALMAARFFARQPRIVAAVTGTSGKTSTAEFTRQIWQLLGRRAASLGTLGLVAPGASEYLLAHHAWIRSISIGASPSWPMPGSIIWPWRPPATASTSSASTG